MGRFLNHRQRTIVLLLALWPCCAAPQPSGEPFVLAQSQLSSDSEAMLRTSLAALKSGSPNYQDMEPMLRIAVEQQLPAIRQRFSRLGALRRVEFVGPQSGHDVFKVTFENGITSWAIQVGPSGKISGLWFQ